MNGEKPAREADPRIARTRERVLSATLALLAERGAGGVTVEAVAERSGVAKSSIYRHWPGLPPLILEAFGSIDPATPGPVRTGRLREELELFLGELARTVTEAPWAPLMATLVEAAERDTELRQLFGTLIEQRRAALRDMLATGVSRGELPSGTDPELLAQVLGGTLFYRRLISHERVDTVFVRHLLDLVLPAVVSGGAGSQDA